MPYKRSDVYAEYKQTFKVQACEGQPGDQGCLQGLLTAWN